MCDQAKKKSWTIKDGGMSIDLFTDGKSVVIARARVSGERSKFPLFPKKPKQYHGKAVLKGDDVFDLKKGIRIAVRQLRFAIKSDLGRAIAQFRRMVFAEICRGKYMGGKP